VNTDGGGRTGRTRRTRRMSLSITQRRPPSVQQSRKGACSIPSAPTGDLPTSAAGPSGRAPRFSHPSRPKRVRFRASERSAHTNGADHPVVTVTTSGRSSSRPRRDRGGPQLNEGVRSRAWARPGGGTRPSSPPPKPPITSAHWAQADPDTHLPNVSPDRCYVWTRIPGTHVERGCFW
jgi:hypothetical protein